MLGIAFFAIFIIVIALLIYKDRKNVKTEGIIFIRRTQKGKKFIENVSDSHPRFWRYVSVIGIAIAVLFLSIGVYFLASNAINITKGTSQDGVKLTLPGPEANTSIPALMIVPWWIWVCGVALVMIPHEMMHGVVCRLEKIRIKSLGWVLLVFLPGAFVEPDEKQLKKAKRSTRLKVYAAGSFANIVIGFSLLLVLILGFMFFSPGGVAFLAGNNTALLHENATGVITQINGVHVNNVSALESELSKYNPGDTITINVTEKTYMFTGFYYILPKVSISGDLKNTTVYTIILKQDPNNSTKPYIVENYITAYKSDFDPEIYQNFNMFVLWMFVFSVGVGIVNLLPIKPLDGGFIFQDLVGYATKNTKKITIAVSIIVLGLLLFNMFGPLFF